jgi:carbon-monoxide dehydrogenase medium subunit
MNGFQMLRAASVKEAVSMLQANQDAQLIAGGQTLIPSLKHGLARPAVLVDLAKVEAMRGITVDAKEITFGAMTTHAEVAASPDVRRAIPVLSELAGNIGDRMVRNLGTIGGSVANNDPAADYPAALLALAATIQTDRRKLSAADFFVDMFATALEPGEIVTSISFPLGGAAAYEKFRNPASRYAMVGAFVSRQNGAVRVAITGAAGVVFRFTAMEEALQKSFTAETADAVVLPADGLNGDMHASAAYRAQMVTVMTSRAVSAAARQQ